MGYDSGNAFRIFFENSKKVIISQDVTFVEEAANETDYGKSESYVQFELPGMEDDIFDSHETPEILERDSDIVIDINPTGAEDGNLDHQSAEQLGNQDEEGGECAEISLNLDELTYIPNLRRSHRGTAGVAPDRFGFPSANVVSKSATADLKVPTNFDEAIGSEHRSEWMDAMKEEIAALQKMKTWILVDIPKGRKAIPTKWVYDIKHNSNGELERFKARIVAKGFMQKAGVDYFEVFAPVTRYTTLRLAVAISVQFGWNRVALDVKTAFLNSPLDEEIYVTQPDGFIEKGHERKVYLLQKALYGLKQASRAWNILLRNFMESFGFKCSEADPAFFVYCKNEVVILAVVYVDDIFLTGNDLPTLENVIKYFMNRFDVRICRKVSKFLGISLKWDDKSVTLHHGAMIIRLLDYFNMSDCKFSAVPIVSGNTVTDSNDDVCNISVTLFQQLVGSLLYLANTTRPDICYAVGFLSRHIHKPTTALWKIGKGILRYLKGTIELGVRYRSMDVAKVIGYCDSDFAQEKPSRKSISGYTFMFAGGPISWRSKQQSVIAQSTVETEFVALSLAVREALWIKKFKLDIPIDSTVFDITIFEDNQGCISLTKQNVINEKSKHIDVKYQLIVYNVQKGEIDVEYMPTVDMLADVMTKPLMRNRFLYLLKQIGCYE